MSGNYRKEWCRQKSTLVQESDFPLQPRRVRCPDCKKNFETSISNCAHDDEFGQACCWYEYLPPHKCRSSKNKEPKRRN